MGRFLSLFESGILILILSKKRDAIALSSEFPHRILHTLRLITHLTNRNISLYLSQPTLREELGVSSKVPANYTFASWEVNKAFQDSGDQLRVARHYVNALLERNVRVLIYNGMYDAMCNWVGSEALTREFEWTGQKEYNSVDLRSWEFEGEHAGWTRSSGPLTFVSIEGAGHMVSFTFIRSNCFSLVCTELCIIQTPYDKPRETLEMVKIWLDGVDM